MPLNSWRDFWQYDRTWLGSTTGTAGRVEAWAHVGHNMVAIYPASSGTVSCVYLQDTTTINSSDDAFYLDDKDIDLVYDLCEIVWHLHLRNYRELQHKMDAFTKTIAPYVGGQ
jgi:multidrug resistance efflux pump